MKIEKNLKNNIISEETEDQHLNKGIRYNSHPSGVECIDIVRHKNFNCGNAIKYIWRRNLKGTPIQDLKKARYYIDDEIKRLENEQSQALQQGHTQPAW